MPIEARMVLRTLFAMPAMKYLLSPLRGHDMEPCIFFAEMISTLELRSHHGAALNLRKIAELVRTAVRHEQRATLDKRN